MFLERKILGRLHGEKQAEFESIIGLRALKDDIKHFGKENPLTALVPVLKDTDPDDAFCNVPYGKFSFN
jgi:leukotriene-A4 hydrolase